MSTQIITPPTSPLGSTPVDQTSSSTISLTNSPLVKLKTRTPRKPKLKVEVPPNSEEDIKTPTALPAQKTPKKTRGKSSEPVIEKQILKKAARTPSIPLQLWSSCVKEVSKSLGVKPPIRKGTKEYEAIQELYKIKSQIKK
jgi:hypothetical protein